MAREITPKTEYSQNASSGKKRMSKGTRILLTVVIVIVVIALLLASAVLAAGAAGAPSGASPVTV